MARSEACLALSHGARRTGSAAAGLVAALLLGIAGDAAAQDPGAARHRVPITDSVYTRVTTVLPRSAAPGDEVTVRARLLPAVTPVQISFGGTRSGFEVVAQVMTAVSGELAERITVRVPKWAERDQTYLFIVVDMYFKPLAASDVFHVTDRDGRLLRRGRITDEAAPCQALRGEDGELYYLTGRIGEWATGDAVTVEGTIAASATCRDGTTIQVSRIQRGARHP